MKRRPPYDEFFDRHRLVLGVVLTVGAFVAVLAVVGLIGAAVGVWR